MAVDQIGVKPGKEEANPICCAPEQFDGADYRGRYFAIQRSKGGLAAAGR